MPFIYEPIPEADKQRINFEEQAKSTGGFGSVPFSWCVDRERDLYLVCFRMGGSEASIPGRFCFSYKGMGLAMFEVVVSDGPNLGTAGRVWIYNVLPIFFSPSLKSYEEEITPLIENALTVFGLYFPYETNIEVIFQKMNNKAGD